MNKPHKHAELIKAWADGATIEYWDAAGKKWCVVSCPAWVLSDKYRVQPERVFPISALTEQEIWDVYSGPTTVEGGLRDVANAAVKRYILDTENGI